MAWFGCFGFDNFFCSVLFGFSQTRKKKRKKEKRKKNNGLKYRVAAQLKIDWDNVDSLF